MASRILVLPCALSLSSRWKPGEKPRPAAGNCGSRGVADAPGAQQQNIGWRSMPARIFPQTKAAIGRQGADAMQCHALTQRTRRLAPINAEADFSLRPCENLCVLCV